jgi:lysozyme
MNIGRLRKELEQDEGCVFSVYLDHLDKKTFGIGHLILPTDPEYSFVVGMSVSKLRVHDCFEEDIKTVLEDCVILYEDFYSLPESVQHVLANMMFNLGRTRLTQFRDLKKAIEARDYNAAADAMIDSRWYTQVPNRAERLVQRMRVTAYNSESWDKPSSDIKEQ